MCSEGVACFIMCPGQDVLQRSSDVEDLQRGELWEKEKKKRWKYGKGNEMRSSKKEVKKERQMEEEEGRKMDEREIGTKEKGKKVERSVERT